MEELLEKAIESLTSPKPDNQKTKPTYVKVEVEDDNGNKEYFRLLDNGQIIKPVTVYSVVKMSDYELQCYLDDLGKKTGLNYADTRKYEIAYEEAAKRGLVEKIPF